MVPLLLSALTMGLLGSTHCALMCGGVVGMTCSALPPSPRSKPGSRTLEEFGPEQERGSRSGPLVQLGYVLAYNLGRITSYATAGALAGGVGATLASFGAIEPAQLALRIAAGAMMVAVGLYVAGLARALSWLERAAEPWWRRVAPLARRFVPVRSPPAAFALGLLWGWLPCGLVYAALAASATSGSAARGAATMAAFGAGTLPALVTMGSAATVVRRAARHRWVRASAGVVLVAFGVVQVAHVGRALAAERGAGAACCAGHGHP
jgi:sulfite exporter TauE/SafE